MAKERTWDASTRGWLAAAVLAAGAMLGWLGWHAIDAAATLQALRESHVEAALAHDSMLRLEAEIQRTAQLAIATGRTEWLGRHTESEQRLRALIEGLQGGATSGAAELDVALAALDEMSRIEQRAFALLADGQRAEAFELVTGQEYAAGLAALGGAIRRFDDGYHDWMLDRSLGLSRGETFSLLGALVLFAVAIGAWVLLISRLQREKGALLREMDARSRAEAELLQAQKYEVLGELAGTVAHDVDNVLSAIAGYTSLARRSGDGQVTQSALDGLDRAVRHGRGLTRNLLAFARPGHALMRAVDVGALIDQTRDWLLPLVPESITLECSNEAGRPLWVEADPVQLQQALINLALNARDAMPDGGVLRITLRALPGPAGDEAAGEVCLEVTDTGCGMDEDTLRRAREPFFSTKPTGEGTGLGLVSAERIVRAHGGKLQIESSPGAGTRIRILLPERSGVVPRVDTGTDQPKVLVASGSAYSRELLCDMLEDLGLATRQIGGAENDTLKPASARDAALLLLDWRAAPAGAVTALRSLRAAGVHTPAILLLDEAAPGQDPLVDNELADLALVVSREAPLGELGQLACRMVASTAGASAA